MSKRQEKALIQQVPRTALQLACNSLETERIIDHGIMSKEKKSLLSQVKVCVLKTIAKTNFWELTSTFLIKDAEIQLNLPKGSLSEHREYIQGIINQHEKVKRQAVHICQPILTKKRKPMSSLEKLAKQESRKRKAYERDNTCDLDNTLFSNKVRSLL